MELHGLTTDPKVRMPDLDDFEAFAAFASDVENGLQAKEKSLPAKYHYDEEGSRLFDRITEQPEYYLTRKEFEILDRHAAEILSHADDGAEVYELGPGSGMKAVTLLSRGRSPNAELKYRPIDVSEGALASTKKNFSTHLPRVTCSPLLGDFAELASHDPISSDRQALFLFLGSSIGNYTPRQQREFCVTMARATRPGDLFLCGFDLLKDRSELNAAYNDANGVTEEFNFNLIERLNREFVADFERENFSRSSAFDPKTNAVETYLVARRAHRVSFEGLGLEVDFAEGEKLHIESSYKFSLAEIEELARATGFTIVKHFTDAEGFFTDSLWMRSGLPAH